MPPSRATVTPAFSKGQWSLVRLSQALAGTLTCVRRGQQRAAQPQWRQPAGADRHPAGHTHAVQCHHAPQCGTLGPVEPPDVRPRPEVVLVVTGTARLLGPEGHPHHRQPRAALRREPRRLEHTATPLALSSAPGACGTVSRWAPTRRCGRVEVEVGRRCDDVVRRPGPDVDPPRHPGRDRERLTSHRVAQPGEPGLHVVGRLAELRRGRLAGTAPCQPPDGVHRRAPVEAHGLRRSDLRRRARHRRPRPGGRGRRLLLLPAHRGPRRFRGPRRPAATALVPGSAPRRHDRQQRRQEGHGNLQPDCPRPSTRHPVHATCGGGPPTGPPSGHARRASRRAEPVPADRRLRVPVRLRGQLPDRAERGGRVDVPAAARLAERLQRDARPQRRRRSASARTTRWCRPPAATCRAAWCVETTWQTRTGWLIVRDALCMGRGTTSTSGPGRTAGRRPTSTPSTACCALVRCVSGSVDLSMTLRAGRSTTAGAEPTWEYDGAGYGEVVATAEGQRRRAAADDRPAARYRGRRAARADPDDRGREPLRRAVVVAAAAAADPGGGRGAAAADARSTGGSGSPSATSRTTRGAATCSAAR